jgi:hypothetical protein
MNKFFRSIQRFMIGRYGHDQLNLALLISYFSLSILNSIFFRYQILNIMSWLIFIIALYRSLSKKISARRKENQVYLKWTKPFRRRISVLQSNVKDRQHKVYICPQCNTKVRVPSKRGKIAITCPSCRREFTKRS